MALYNVVDFGAVGDGQIKNTDAIRLAMTACAAQGGGTVYVPAGIYVTGPIHLQNHITLYLESGATLLFCRDFAEYPPVRTRWEGVECYGFSPLIYGKDLHDVSLMGRGTLDGQGDAWWSALAQRRAEGPFTPHTDMELELARLNPGYENAGSGGGGRGMQFLRPPLVQLMNCRNVRLDGLTHKNSPFWNTHLVYCQDIVIHGVRFQNPPDAPNTDGLDIDSCRNVMISDCAFDVGDDCICLKSGIDEDGRRVGKPTENVTIANCTMLHGHGGVVIGSEIAGSIRNVTISNCIFLGTERGIRMKSRRGRGGVVEDIRVSNIMMKNVLCPVVLNLFYCCGATPDDAAFSPEPQPVTEETSVFRNIFLSNIVARDVRAAAGFFHGLPEMPIENVSLHDITIDMAQSPDVPGGEPAMVFGLEPMAGRGMVGKYLKHVSLSHVTVKTRHAEGLSLEESRDIDIHAFAMPGHPRDMPGIVLNQVHTAYIHGCRNMAFSPNFLVTTGERAHDIIVADHALNT